MIYFRFIFFFLIFIQSLLADDPEVMVQCSFAENISLLAETALRFLELAQLNNSNSDRDDESQYQVHLLYES